MEHMRRVQSSWAKRGSLFYIIGCWFSLCHFISFMLMQCVIFLGLDKLHIPWQQQHLGHHRRSEGNNALFYANFVKGKDEKNLLSSTIKVDYSPQPKNETQSTLFVATFRGRAFLRCLTMCIVSTFFHMLLGIRYFVLLHIILLLIFAFFVLFVPQRAFILYMGRLWKLALFAILVVGLFSNMTMDVLMVRNAVKRTTTSVVLRSNMMDAVRGTNGGSDPIDAPRSKSSASSVRGTEGGGPANE